MMKTWNLKTLQQMLVVALALFAGIGLAHAGQEQEAAKKSAPTQAQLALDHGPHAQVTPAVKRARLAAQAAAGTGSK